MTNTTSTSFAAAALAIGATLFTFGLSAGPALAATSMDVSVRGADLSTVEGRAAVDARIDRAARHVCGANGVDRALAARMAARHCVAEAVAGARPQLAAIKASRVRLAAR